MAPLHSFSLSSAHLWNAHQQQQQRFRRVRLFISRFYTFGRKIVRWEHLRHTRFAFIFIAARCRNSSLSKYCVRCLFLKAISWKWLPAALNYISWWFTAGIMWEMASDITSRCWLHPVNLLAAGVPPLGRVFRSTDLIWAVKTRPSRQSEKRVDSGVSVFAMVRKFLGGWFLRLTQCESWPSLVDPPWPRGAGAVLMQYL